MKLNEHPSVLAVQRRTAAEKAPRAATPELNADTLRQLCLDAGADDVGFVEIERAGLGDEERESILSHFPHAKTLVSFVVKMNREPIRSTARSVANLEFHHTGDLVNETGRCIVGELEDRGVRAINPSMGFPMEMDQFPGRIWVVSHKIVAQEAGLGVMGIHRNIIHPKFGNFILLGTIVTDATVTKADEPLDFAPCLECKLCVAACPVGAIGADGHFNFNACYTHNYREFMGGFTDWVEDVVDSKNRVEYRTRVRDEESASVWQSLSFGANYKAAYCLSVCPAGEDVLGPFLENRSQFIKDQVKPLQQKAETVYVIPKSDAEDVVAKRFPNKRIQHVNGSLRPRTIDGFRDGLPLVFQPGKAGDLDATYHFSFTGAEQRRLTVVIRKGRVTVTEGQIGTPDLRVTADTNTWLGFLAGEKSLVVAFLMFRIKIDRNPLLLIKFGRCFPS